MTERVHVEFKWFGPAMPEGAPVKLDGRTVGRLADPLPSARGVFGGVVAKAYLDRSFVDKLGDGSGYGFPKVSFLITRD